MCGDAAVVHARLMTTRRDFDAVLFDLDGVLTATSKLHAACWKQTFDEVLAEWSEAPVRRRARLPRPRRRQAARGRGARLPGRPRIDVTESVVRSIGDASRRWSSRRCGPAGSRLSRAPSAGCASSATPACRPPSSRRARTHARCSARRASTAVRRGRRRPRRRAARAAGQAGAGRLPRGRRPSRRAARPRDRGRGRPRRSRRGPGRRVRSRARRRAQRRARGPARRRRRHRRRRPRGDGRMTARHASTARLRELIDPDCEWCIAERRFAPEQSCRARVRVRRRQRLCRRARRPGGGRPGARRRRDPERPARDLADRVPRGRLRPRAHRPDDRRRRPMARSSACTSTTSRSISPPHGSSASSERSTCGPACSPARSSGRPRAGAACSCARAGSPRWQTATSWRSTTRSSRSTPACGSPSPPSS